MIATIETQTITLVTESAKIIKIRGASHNHDSSQKCLNLKFHIVRPIDILVHMETKTVGEKLYMAGFFISSGLQIEYKKGDLDKRNTLVS